jgi:hypothetical protein
MQSVLSGPSGIRKTMAVEGQADELDPDPIGSA